MIDPGLAYSTFLGGSAVFPFEAGFSIVVDSQGYAYVTGQSNSIDFPTSAGAFDATLNGEDDVFVTKLTQDGSALVYSTFLGGTSEDRGFGIAVSAQGHAYVTGRTSSADFPTTPGALDTTYSINDAFVTQLSADGSELVYSTFLGGSGGDTGNRIVVDHQGFAYVTGTSNSADFPALPGSFDVTLGFQDLFVAKLNPSGSALVYSTFLGGSDSDTAGGIAVDREGHAYVTGLTNSSDFPTTPGAFDTSFDGGADAFITKLSVAGSALIYSTLLGGTTGEGGSGIEVDQFGHAYVAGDTSSEDFPTTPGAFDRTLDGFNDVFVTKLNPDGSALVYSTFLGGTGSGGGDGSSDIALGPRGHAYVTGSTQSTDFPTTAGAFDTTFNGGFQDAFVTQLTPDGSALVFSTFLGGEGLDASLDIAVSLHGDAYVTGRTSSADFPTTLGAFSTTLGAQDCGPTSSCDAFVTKFDTMVDDIHTVDIDIRPGGSPNIINRRSRGSIPVAILSNPTFDALSEVDTSSLTFGRTGDEPSLAFCNPRRNVNDDRLLDVVCHFNTEVTGFLVGDTQGVLKGETRSGVPITGTDSVRIVN